jgi:hypothetical protein
MHTAKEHVAKEPVLFLSIFLHRHSQGPGDPRVALLRQVDHFVDCYKLQLPEKKPALYETASSIELHIVDDAREFMLLFAANAGFSDPQAGSLYDATIYAYHDSIIVQLQISSPPERFCNPLEAWQQFTAEMLNGFGESIESSAAASIFGVSAVYWFISGTHARPESYEPCIRELVGESAGRTGTDLGPLWNCDAGFLGTNCIHQDLWVFVIPDAEKEEDEANDRYYTLVQREVPAFAEVALARHKIFFELSQHDSVREDLESRGGKLEAKTVEILAEQRRLAGELDDLASDTAIDFENSLAKATNYLAEFRNRIGELKGLCRTIEVNRRNYLLHCVRLISAKQLKKVEQSRDRERAAGEVLDSLTDDGIFATDLGLITQKYQQISTDLGYAESVADRHTLALRSATDQLRIAGEREIAEMARHMAVDSAAVVASVAALVVIELAVKPHFEATKEAHKFHSLEAWLLVTWVILLVYGGAQAFGAGFRGAKLVEKDSGAIRSKSAASFRGFLASGPGLKSIVIGFAAAFAWITMFHMFHRNGASNPPDPDALDWPAPLLIVCFALVGAIIGYLAYLGVWHLKQKARKKNRQNTARLKSAGETER